MVTLPILTSEEQRVLGCLLEKEITVPASYPLTLNALRTACNQTSSREPVVDYDERTVQDGVRSLKDHGLARVTWMEYGKRTLKYAQTAVDELVLADDERALLTVLLLRGPQSAGELKVRTDRLFQFSDRAGVEATLARLAQRPEPLVQRLARRAGQQDPRWVHLLGEISSEAPDAAAVDRELVLEHGVDQRDAAVLSAYEALADGEPGADPASQLRPFEHWFLTRVAELAGPHRLADVGCGDGDVTAFLARCGADPTGFDLSESMVAAATQRHADVDFRHGDLRRLLRPDTAPGWGGIVAWFSLIHFAPSELAAAVRTLAATLVPGGVLAIAVHAGNAVEPTTRWAGQDLPVPLVRQDPADVRKAFVAAGLANIESYEVNDGDARLYLIAVAG